MTAIRPSPCLDVVSEEFQQSQNKYSMIKTSSSASAPSNTEMAIDCSSNGNHSEKENPAAADSFSQHGKSDSDVTAESTTHHEELNSSGRTSSDVTTTHTSSSCVSFGSIQTREYNRALGDCWDVSHGLAIGWEFQDNAPVPIDSLESNEDTKPRMNILQSMIRKMGLQPKPRRRKSVRVDSFTGKQLNNPKRREARFDQKRTSITERAEILQSFGYSWEDLAEAEEERARNNLERYLEMY